EPRESAAAMLLADIDPGKAERGGLPQRRFGEFLALVPARGVPQPFLARELARGVLEGALLVGEIEIHHPQIRQPHLGCKMPAGIDSTAGVGYAAPGSAGAADVRQPSAHPCSPPFTRSPSPSSKASPSCSRSAASATR